MADTPADKNRRHPSTHSTLRPSDSLGRFELRRQLGQGAQSTVWLAHDPRMDREVAIKVLRPVAGADDQSIQQWLQEARSVGRLKHPGIVPVYEADIEDAQAYLVFEYVEGDTLALLLARQGAVPARDAAGYLMDVLDAIAVAHSEGVVHRDIKPSNILMDRSGRARVMDFGIATRAQTHTPGAQTPLSGTIGYLSPEAIAGAPPAPSMDLFACGLVLAEMLMGKPMINEPDPGRAIYRLAHEQLQLPSNLGAEVDDSLRSLVNRSLARDPAQRFPDARSFFNALSSWRQPAPADAVAGATDAGGTLEFLMRRMRHKTDFPALSDSVIRIQSLATSETESVGGITNQILKDVALTNKLLRVVNSAQYSRGGSISTVSRAVSLVGFNGIRNMALSLVLLEHMQDKGHAAQLKDEFVRSLLAGTLGAEMCDSVREAEDAFIGSMFQNMGRLLTQFYFPEEAEQVRRLVQSKSQPVSEESAAVSVLGLSFESLGLGIAKAWGLPDSIQRCMKHPLGAPPSNAPSDAAERLRWMATAANEMADVMLTFGAEEATKRLAQVARKYARAVGKQEKDLSAIAEKAKAKLQELAQAMDIHVKRGSAAHKVLHNEPVAPSPSLGSQDSDTDSNIRRLELHATQTLEVDGLPPPARSNLVADTLSAGIQDITNSMVDDFKLADVLRMILETMYRAMGFDRIIFCMRDAKTDTITGRFGLGGGVDAFVREFRIPLKGAAPDLFSVVCIKGVDSMISDASEPRIQARLPTWFGRTLNAPAFLLLPLQVKNAPFGLIYADKTQKGALELDEKELALLRTLRNQAVMAFKQSR
jgi:serine/threonine protein kinase